MDKQTLEKKKQEFLEYWPNLCHWYEIKPKGMELSEGLSMEVWQWIEELVGEVIKGVGSAVAVDDLNCSDELIGIRFRRYMYDFAKQYKLQDKTA